MLMINVENIHQSAGPQLVCAIMHSYSFVIPLINRHNPRNISFLYERNEELIF